MSLSIQDCAAQLDLYASLFDKDAKAFEARKAEAKGVVYTAMAWSKDVAERQAHQLHFAASFLRENALLHWTKEPPTREGAYWVRDAYLPRYVVRVYTANSRLWASVVDTRQPDNTACEVSTMTHREWSGPIPEPTD